MKTIDWLRGIIESGLLCEEYTNKANKVKGKKALFDLVCDSNGVSFLCEMRAKGFPLDYDVIKEEFGRYINGKCKPSFETPTMTSTYTSSLYCNLGGEEAIVVDTTLACLLGCECEVRIAPFNFSRICLDQNSKIKLFCPPTSKVIIETWGEEDLITIVEGEDRVRIRRMN